MSLRQFFTLVLAVCLGVYVYMTFIKTPQAPVGDTTSSTSPQSSKNSSESRHVDDATIASLEQNLADHKNLQIILLSKEGDNEAVQFAGEIGTYLTNQSYDVRNNIGVFVEPLYAIGLHYKVLNGQIFAIYVGSKG